MYVNWCQLKKERETVWLMKPKIFTIWLFIEKVC